MDKMLFKNKNPATVTNYRGYSIPVIFYIMLC